MNSMLRTASKAMLGCSPSRCHCQWQEDIEKSESETVLSACPLLALSGHFWMLGASPLSWGKADISDACSNVCL